MAISLSGLAVNGQGISQSEKNFVYATSPIIAWGLAKLLIEINDES